MIRNKTETYDNMLRIQADMCLDVETKFFENKHWQDANVVLDFGTGNGYYISQLASKFPDKEFIAVEHDPAMAALAQKRCNKLDNLKVLSGTYNVVPDNLKFDFVILRLVLGHLPDRLKLFSWIQKHVNNRGCILVIDADDDLLTIKPEIPIFLETLFNLRRNIEAKGGCRKLKDILNGELSNFGFISRKSESYIIKTSKCSSRSIEKMYVYMYLTAELHTGSPLPQDISDELFSWVLSKQAYVQYGLFTSLHEKEYRK